MRPASFVAAAAALLAVSTAWAQTSATPRQGVSPAPGYASPPPTQMGYVVRTEFRATVPGFKPAGAAPEAQAVAGALKSGSTLTSRFYLAGDVSRQEILSTDFVLPPGTLVFHRGGEKTYTIADPKAKTYLVMDSEALLNALEGGAGIVNSQYQATVQHTDERKTIAGMDARKSVLTVTYVSSIPFENDRVLVQQKSAIEVWHTSALVSSAATDHFFFNFQRDKTSEVRKTMAREIGFPMEVNIVVTQGTGKKGETPQPGSLHMVVTEATRAKIDSDALRIPPEGYRRIEKNPYFAAGALSDAGAKISREPAKQP